MNYLKLLKLLLPVCFVLLFFFFLTPTKTFAANYYVDCTSGSDSNTGTSTGQAVQTLQRFSNSGTNQIDLVAGESLFLKRGCTFSGYKIYADWDGSSGSRITIDAYGTGADPIIMTPRSGNGGVAIDVWGQYITIQHVKLDFDQSLADHTYTGAPGEDCSTQATGYYYGVNINSGSASSPNHPTPANNIIVQYITATNQTVGVHFRINESSSAYTTHDNKVLYSSLINNTVGGFDPINPSFLNGAKGVNAAGNDNEIGYNYVADNTGPCLQSNDYYESNAIELYDTKRNYVHHNTSIRNRVFSEVGGPVNLATAPDFQADGNVFAYNIHYTDQPRPRFLVLHGDSTNGPTINSHVYNNTVYQTNAYQNDAKGVSCGGCTQAQNSLFMRNNIIVTPSQAFFLATGGSMYESNNIYWDLGTNRNANNFFQLGTGASYPIDSTSRKEDPLFVSTGTNLNFRVQAASFAINNGSSIPKSLYSTLASSDIEQPNGTLVPQGSAADIGAYENGVSEATVNATTYASDTFTRTTSNGWGNADIGGTWTTSVNGTGSSRNTDGTKGNHILGACSATDQSFLNSLNVLNNDQTVKVSSNKASTGENQFIYFTSRKQSVGTWEYRYTLTFNDGVVKLSAGKLQGTNTLVSIGAGITVPDVSHTANSEWWYRSQTFGTNPTRIRTKVWAVGTSEPSVWNIDRTDSEATLQASGAVGLRSNLAATCTSAPLTVSFDDYTVTSMNTPTINLTAQNLDDCTTGISTGTSITDTTMCISATVNDADNPDSLTLQSEVQPVGTDFTNTANFTGSAVDIAGTSATVTTDITGLIIGTNYHWQTRVSDSLGNTSPWVSYGGNTELDTDFGVESLPLISFTTTSASGSEPTTSITLPISIDKTSTQNISVGYSVSGGTATGGGTDYTLASGTATIVAGSLNTTIPVTIVNDAIDEDNETIIVTISGPTNATLGANTTYTYTIQDNETAGFSINPSSAINATEGSVTGSYTVKLNTQPTSTVTVNLSPDSQVSLDKSTLTFTTSDYFTLQTVTATAVNDAVAEGTHNGIITHTVTSSDTKYNAFSMPTKTVRITDNDSAGVSIAESDGATNVTEGGATDTYNVVLVTQPTNNVTITLSPDSYVNIDSGTLVFTDTNWDTPQTVTVTAANNSVVDGTHTGSIAHTAASSDLNYNSITIASVNASVTDNDTAGITVTESSSTTNITEGGSTDSYTVVLTSQPSSNVTVTLTNDNQVTLNAGTLPFTTANWDTPQTVTVTAVNDDIAEGADTSTITHAATSSDLNYNGISISNVTANITDNDTAAVTLTETGGTTTATEVGGTDIFRVVLTSEPTSDVTVYMTSNNVSAVDSVNEVAELVFNSTNWNIGQTVNVSAVNDNIDQGATYTGTTNFEVVSGDSTYDALTLSDLSVTITDNDTAGVTVAQSGGTTAVTEGGATDTYTVVLTSQPTASVTIGLSVASDVSLSSSSLVFTSSNWDTAQTVTVTAVNDSNYQGTRNKTLSHTATSSDTTYSGISISSITVGITDNDTSGVTISTTGGSTTVVEGGATDTYTVVLDSQPSLNVTVSVAGTGGQVTLSDSSLVFTNGNWDTPQTVTVTAVNDLIAEGTDSVVLTHTSSSSDNGFDNLTIGSVNVSITDNDTAGVTITETGGTTEVAESGTTSDRWSVKLNSQPTATVTISLAGDSNVSLDTDTLTFTTSNWNIGQTVVATAINDEIEQGLYSNTITHTAISSDGTYNGISIANLFITITDNDTALITITEVGGTTDVTEEGTTDDIFAILTSQPTEDVTITMTGTQVTTVKRGTNSNVLTFTSSNWNVTQAVTVTAINDPSVEGDHTGSITFVVSSNDTYYDGAALSTIIVNIRDNDTNNQSNSSSNNSGGNSSNPPSCPTDKPNGSPYLFEVDRVGTEASLHFTPPQNPYSRFTVSFGADDNTEQYNGSFSQSNATGALIYTVNHLNPKSTYSFKVRAENSCTPGNWSNVVRVGGVNLTSKALTRSYPSLLQQVVHPVQTFQSNFPAQFPQQAVSTTTNAKPVAEQPLIPEPQNTSTAPQTQTETQPKSQPATNSAKSTGTPKTETSGNWFTGIINFFKNIF